jgi:hypothetical protein
VRRHVWDDMHLSIKHSPASLSAPKIGWSCDPEGGSNVVVAQVTATSVVHITIVSPQIDTFANKGVSAAWHLELETILAIRCVAANYRRRQQCNASRILLCGVNMF